MAAGRRYRVHHLGVVATVVVVVAGLVLLLLLVVGLVPDGRRAEVGRDDAVAGFGLAELIKRQPVSSLVQLPYLILAKCQIVRL